MRDDGVPGHFWRFDFRMGIMVRDGLPVIMVAVGHNRIAVIQAFFDQVDFIAALVPHLMFSETAIGIARKTQYISLTQGPDLGRNAALVREWTERTSVV